MGNPRNSRACGQTGRELPLTQNYVGKRNMQDSAGNLYLLIEQCLTDGLGGPDNRLGFVGVGHCDRSENRELAKGRH